MARLPRTPSVAVRAAAGPRSTSALTLLTPRLAGVRTDEGVGLSFRDDGRATLEWVARYLEDRRELPVLARVEPGEIRAQLPARAPDVGEPFSAVLADLDAILLPGITHWNHPRFFAYFGITASEPGILAELL